MICNGLSDRDRTGILRRNGLVIEINEEALVRCEERVRYRQKSQQKIQRISGELGAQSRTANSTCASRQSHRIRRRMKERAAQERTKEQRLVVGLLERQLNSLQNGNASRMTATFSALSSWRQRGREDTEFTGENSDTEEKPQVSTGDTRFTGVVIGTEMEKISKKYFKSGRGRYFAGSACKD